MVKQIVIEIRTQVEQLNFRKINIVFVYIQAFYKDIYENQNITFLNFKI